MFVRQLHGLQSRLGVLEKSSDLRNQGANVLVQLLGSSIIENCLSEASGTQRAKFLDQIFEIDYILVYVLLNINPLWRQSLNLLI